MHESTGPLSESDVDRITNLVKNLEGVIHIEITGNAIPNVVNISHRSSGMPLRDII